MGDDVPAGSFHYTGPEGFRAWGYRFPSGFIVLEWIPDSVPLEFTSNGMLRTKQTCWVVKGETAAVNQTRSDSSDEWSGGSVGRAASEFDDHEFSFTPQYDIPADTLEVAIRSEHVGTDDQIAFDVLLNTGNTDQTITTNSTLSWDTTAALSHPELPAGQTVQVELDALPPGGDPDAAVDVISIQDGRYSYDFDNAVHDPAGYLDGPQPHPDAVPLENVEITTTLGVEEVTIEVVTDDGAGVAELAIAQDGTGSYDPATNTLSHSLQYSELSTTVQTRVAVGRSQSLTPRDQTPRVGYEGQGLDSLEISAILDDTPVLTDRSFNGMLIDVLREVFDYGNFVSEARQDGDQTLVEVTQLEGRPTDVDPDIADYSVDRQTEDVLERAIVYGGAQRVTRQTVDVTIGEWVDLPFPDSRLVEGKTSIYSGDTEYTLGEDYQLRRETVDGQPRIKSLSDGSLSDGQTVSVDADVKPRGVYTAGDADAPERNVEDYDIPGLASKQMCDQVALYLVEETGDAIVDAEVTVPHDSVEWSVIEAIDPAQLPGSGPYQVREIQAEAGQTTLQLGQGQTVNEAVQEIRDRTQRNSERV